MTTPAATEPSNQFLDTLKDAVAPSLLPLFQQRDAAARLVEELPRIYAPDQLVQLDGSSLRAWELSGLFFFNQGRFYEALSIFTPLYLNILRGQRDDLRVHKGVPLVWIADCFASMGFPVHAKRYLMLTLCEDALRGQGKVSPEDTGIYFRLVWRHGLPESELSRYAKNFQEVAAADPASSRFPEWMLQRVDDRWMTEIPSPAEGGIYSANLVYLRYLVDQLGDGSGQTLEYLAEYLLSCMPGCRTKRRRRSGSTDYDVVCSMEGFEVDFRSEFGRYFVCECKDWSEPADFTTMAKFCRVLDSTKARFGILFSKSGISGAGKTQYAEREQLKVFQDRGIVIVVVDEQDLNQVEAGANFGQILRDKYEAVRLDLKAGRGDDG